MAISSLRKVTLIGPTAEKEELVAGMQRLACMHVIDLANDGRKPPWEHPAHSDLLAALQYLQRCPAKRPLVEADSGTDVFELAKEILANRHHRLELQEERDSLTDTIVQTEPWGEFELPEADALGGQAIWFYRIRQRNLADLPHDLVYQVISTDREFCYVAVAAPEPVEGMPASSQVGSATT